MVELGGFTHDITGRNIKRKSRGGSLVKKELFLLGMATGALVGLLIALNGFFGLGFPSFGGFVAYVLGTILISAFGVKKMAQMRSFSEPSLKHLIPVAFLTFFLPVLGPAFGAPNSDITTVATIALLGAIGGAFWSIPFVLWSYYKSHGDDSNYTTTIPVETTAPATIVVKNITINDSVVMGDVSNDEE